MIRYVVFDFDGTLVDTLHILYEIANGLSKKYKFRHIDHLEELQNLSPQEVIQNLRIRRYKIPFVVRRILKELESRVDEINFFPGTLTMIDALSKDYKLGILSSNKKKNVMFVLERYGILDKFEFVYTGSSLFGKHRKMKKIMRKKRIKPSEIIYVGDEVRDITSAKKAGIPIISVTYGYNKKDVLLRHSPEFTADKPGDIVKIMNQ